MNTYATWEALQNAFLLKLFPSERTTRLQNDIRAFHQEEGESLYSVWELFGKLQRACPHHNVRDYELLQLFYKAILDQLTSKNYRWSAHNIAGRKGGKLEVDAATMLESKMDALFHKIVALTATHASKAHVAQDSTPDEAVHFIPTEPPAPQFTELCATCGIQGHSALDCSFQVQAQANVLNSFNRPRNDPYSPTYNPGWRNHPNFSYRNNLQPQQG